MTTTHTHTYRFPDVFMLTLPDVDGCYDASLLWRCLSCDSARHATGVLHKESRGLTVAAWETRGVGEETMIDTPQMHRTCLVLDVKGFLLNNTRLSQYKGMFHHDDGRLMRPQEAKMNLLDELGKGHLFLPFCKHRPFDHTTGECSGEVQQAAMQEARKVQ